LLRDLVERGLEVGLGEFDRFDGRRFALGLGPDVLPNGCSGGFATQRRQRCR
jgi:hypothetical protein